MLTANTNYSLLANVYDLLGHFYSGGQIHACKKSQMEFIYPGAKVLYAGAGGGQDALMASQKGADVTVVELSENMLIKAKNSFSKANSLDRIECIQGDIAQHNREETYDVVVANFFLNVFDETMMQTVLEHLSNQLRPGGRLLIADFKPLSLNPLAKLFQQVYFGTANLTFRILANNPIHPIYNYPRYFSKVGLALAAYTDFRLFGWGPAWYRTWTGLNIK